MKEKEFKPGCPQLNIQLGCDGWETEIVFPSGIRFSQKWTHRDNGGGLIGTPWDSNLENDEDREELMESIFELTGTLADLVDHLLRG